MTPRPLALGLVLSVALLPAGCKFVRIADQKAASTKNASMFSDDTAALDQKAAGMWAPKVLPYMKERAVDVTTLRADMAKGFDAAGKKYGYREGTSGAPWNFSVRFSGKIVEADTKSRAAKLSIDTNGDGKADATVALGPVILSTSLRDVLPFVRFDDYKNQIAFAGISRSLNTYAYEHVLKSFPRSDLVGKSVEGIGATALSSATSEMRIVPIELKETEQ